LHRCLGRVSDRSAKDRGRVAPVPRHSGGPFDTV
jgi:hypothetical protein